jgi:hypothetical protein
MKRSLPNFHLSHLSKVLLQGKFVQMPVFLHLQMIEGLMIRTKDLSSLVISGIKLQWDQLAIQIENL